MPAKKPSAGLHFLVSTDIEKPDPELRKFIRSHVMIGKNKGRNRAAGKKKQDVKEVVLASSPHVSPVYTDETSTSSTTPSTATTEAVLTLSIPRKFGSDIAPLSFPDAVEPRTVEIVLRFSSIAKRILFPLESCVLFERKSETWIEPLKFDPVFLHTMIFTSQSYFDLIAAGRGSVTTKVASYHLLKALKFLRERISGNNDHVKLSDTTVAAVMALTGHALLSGDFKLATNHIKGLHRIFNLRGGLATFKYNPKLLTEILRCDIGMVLHCGSKPLFFNHSTSSEPFLQYPGLEPLLRLQKPAALDLQDNTAIFLHDVDGALSSAWNAMSAFCSVVNYAIQSRQYISIETYLDTMASVMYRLLEMRFELGSSNEAIRLGLLAFAASVFLQWKPLGLSYSHLTFEFRDSLLRLEMDDVPSQLLVWLLMVGAISVFDTIDDAWLYPLLLANTKTGDINTWDEMQGLLKSIMWVGLIHDKAARGVFHRLRNSSSR